MTLAKYPDYKDSQVPWLGGYPSHWRIVPLWALFRRTKRSGYVDEELLSVYRDYGVIPKASRDDNNNKPSDDLGAYQLVDVGDLVINKMKAWQGSVAVSSVRGIVSPAYFTYAALHQQNPRYLHYLMRSARYITGYLSLSKGIRVSQWDLDPEYHSRMPILVPPRDEQDRIAKVLDSETAKIDALVEEQQRLIELLKEKRQAVISQVVTKGQDPNVPMKDSGVEWLGKVPAHWEVRSIRTLASVVRGASPRPAGDPAYFNGDYLPWVTVAEITKDRAVGLTETESYLTEAGVGHSRVLKSGTVIYSNSGATLGVPKILKVDACANDGVVGFEELSEVIDPLFLYHYLDSLTQTIRDMVKQGSGQPNLNTSLVKAIPIPLPPLEEQRGIVANIDTLLRSFDVLSREAEHATEILQERRSALISAAVTGKIDVRGLAA